MTGRKWLIGVLAGVAVLGVLAAGGAVLAQTPSPGGAGNGGRIDSFLNQLAQNLHIDRPTLDNALKTTAKQQVDQAVASGRMTQDQANQIKQRIDNGQLPFGGVVVGGAFGRGGAGAAFGAGACRSSLRDGVASALGMSPSALQQARANGQTIAQIAQSQGKSLADGGSAATGSVKNCLDQQVQSGSLTAEQEQNILQRLQRRLASLAGAQGSGRQGHHRAPAAGGTQ